MKNKNKSADKGKKTVVKNKSESVDEGKKIVMVRCRRGSDPATQGQRCGSMRAYNVSVAPGGRNVTFQCAECKYVWTIPVGGMIDI